MANTIDTEAKRSIRSVTDIDRFRRRYSQTNEGFNIQFVSPVITTYEKYRYYLLKNSTSKSLKQKYYYRPDYLSYDEYGTTSLWTVLLYINDISCIEDFTIPSVFIPTYNAIISISKENESVATPVDIDVLNAPPNTTSTIQLYTSRFNKNPPEQS